MMSTSVSSRIATGPGDGYVKRVSSDIINLWGPVWQWPLLFLVNLACAALVSRFKGAFGALWFGDHDENGETLRLFANGDLVVLAAAAVIYSAVVLVTIADKPVPKDKIGKLPGIYRTDPNVH